MEMSCQIADVNHHANINVNTNVNINTSEIACTAADMLTLIETRVYTPVATSVIQHAITNKNLKESARLFYLLADLYAQFNLYDKDERMVKLSGSTWGNLLDITPASVFQLQRHLEEKEYFKLMKSKNCGNRNNVNKITPDLPESIFKIIQEEPDRKGAKSSKTKGKRSYLDNSKLLIFFNRKQIEMLVRSKKITQLQKLLWVYFYICSYAAYKHSGDWRVAFTQKELAKRFSCATNTISVALKNLREQGYISTDKIFIEDENDPSSNRCDKLLWYVGATFPKAEMAELFSSQKPRHKQYDEFASEVYSSVENKYSYQEVSSRYHPNKPACHEIYHPPHETLQVCNRNIELKTNIKNNETKLAVLGVDDVILNKNIKPTLEPPIQDLKSNNCNEVDILEIKHQANLQKLTPDQVRKATNFAKKLKREKLCSPDLQDIAETELIRQFVHHAANFRMTKLNCLNRDAEVDAALNFAWNAATTGRWRCPTGWGIGFDIRLEQEKYRYENVNSREFKAVNKKIKKFLDS